MGSAIANPFGFSDCGNCHGGLRIEYNMGVCFHDFRYYPFIGRQHCDMEQTYITFQGDPLATGCYFTSLFRHRCNGCIVKIATGTFRCRGCMRKG